MKETGFSTPPISENKTDAAQEIIEIENTRSLLNELKNKIDPLLSSDKVPTQDFLMADIWDKLYDNLPEELKKYSDKLVEKSDEKSENILSAWAILLCTFIHIKSLKTTLVNIMIVVKAIKVLLQIENTSNNIQDQTILSNLKRFYQEYKLLTHKRRVIVEGGIAYVGGVGLDINSNQILINKNGWKPLPEGTHTQLVNSRKQYNSTGYWSEYIPVDTMDLPDKSEQSDPVEMIFNEQRTDVLKEVLEEVSPIEETVISLRYGLFYNFHNSGDKKIMTADDVISILLDQKLINDESKDNVKEILTAKISRKSTKPDESTNELNEIPKTIIGKINSDEGLTLEEIGGLLELSRERIRQIEAKALRKLRHPNRKTRLRQLLESNSPADEKKTNANQEKPLNLKELGFDVNGFLDNVCDLIDQNPETIRFTRLAFGHELASLGKVDIGAFEPKQRESLSKIHKYIKESYDAFFDEVKQGKSDYTQNSSLSLYVIMLYFKRLDRSIINRLGAALAENKEGLGELIKLISTIKKAPTPKYKEWALWNNIINSESYEKTYLLELIDYLQINTPNHPTPTPITP